jgi:glutamine cyclotransferase
MFLYLYLYFTIIMIAMLTRRSVVLPFIAILWFVGSNNLIAQEPGRDVIHTIPAPGKSMGLTWDEFHLWVSDDLNRQYHKLDLESGDILATMDYHETVLYSQGMAFDGKYIWTNGWEDPSGAGSKIFKIDTTTMEIISVVDYPGGYSDNWPHGMTYGGSFLWVTNFKTGTLDKIDPNSGELIGTLPSPTENPIGIAWHNSHLWTNDYGTGLIYKVDPQSGSILGSLAMPGPNCRGMEWDTEYLWTVSFETDLVYQMDVGVLGLGEDHEIAFNLFPNPAKDYILINNLPGLVADGEITIVDLQGKVRATYDHSFIPGRQVRLSIEGLGPGIYFIRISNGNAISTERLVVLD